jgi:ubiquinone/menaquinone biosynthesis C-methylase UbiE
MTQTSTHHQDLQEYYGKILQSTKDLKTKACCLNGDKLPPSVQKALGMLDREILERFYSCGSPIPPLLTGMRILDLGCGTGKDVFVAAQLAGEEGFVIGVDMTEEQLALGRKHAGSHMRKFGFRQTNVEFRQGYMEDLRELGIGDNSIDVVISNCVLNLSPWKEEVFGEIFRVLKPGGELYFSDVFAGRRVPAHLQADPVLHGECLAGAMYTEDFRRLMQQVGWADYRTMSCRKIDLGNPEIEEKIGMVDFYSVTVRAFKLSGLEDICEDYGQVATYRGTVPDHPHFFDLDDHHRFITGKPMLVCGNTAAMVMGSRFGKHFQVTGDRSVHYGKFACAPAAGREEGENDAGGACC